MLYLENLIENAQIALESKPIREQVITNLNDINSLDIIKGVYIIEEINEDIIKTHNNFLAFKLKGTHAMPKTNMPSNILYVGSSRKALKHRLQQHMGGGHKDTYALHLSEWFPVYGQIKITIREYDVSDEVLQLIEDDTSFMLCPAFGRRGAR